MPAQVNGDAKRFFHIGWNVMETAIDMAKTKVNVVFWSEMRHAKNANRKRRGAKLTGALLFCQIIFDVDSSKRD